MKGLPALTGRKRRIYEYIKQCVLTVGYAPTSRQIVEALDLKSTSNVYYVLERLEAMGYITREGQHNYQLTLTELPHGKYTALVIAAEDLCSMPDDQFVQQRVRDALTGL